VDLILSPVACMAAIFCFLVDCTAYNTNMIIRVIIK
jgi:hypothetical protein